MNILHITQFTSHPEGINTVLSALIPEQKKLGHNVYLASTNSNAKCSDIPVFDFSIFNHAIEVIKQQAIDIIVFHGLYNKQYVKISKYLLKQDIPYLILLHGALSKENYKKNHIIKWLANILYFGTFMRKAKSIIYLNQSEYENSIVPQYNKSFLIIPNGCCIPSLSRDKELKDRIKILYMGRLDVIHKGLDILFDALRKCKNNNLNIEVDFYGYIKENEKSYIMDNLDMLAPVVSYKGIAKGIDKEEAYNNADIFILTSRYEGMPMGILEALSHGIPCILTPGTNMSEEVYDANAGWKCELNSDSIFNTIKMAIEDYNLNYKTHSASALELAQRYSWKVIAEKSIEEYKKIMKS